MMAVSWMNLLAARFGWLSVIKPIIRSDRRNCRRRWRTAVVFIHTNAFGRPFWSPWKGLRIISSVVHLRPLLASPTDKFGVCRNYDERRNIGSVQLLQQVGKSLELAKLSWRARNWKLIDDSRLGLVLGQTLRAFPRWSVAWLKRFVIFIYYTILKNV